MADKDLEYKIKTTADTTGAEQAAAGIDKVDKAAKQAGKGAEDLEKTNRDAAGAINDLRNAATGGSAGMLKLGDSIRKVWSLAKANPLGFASAGITAAIPIIKAGLDAWVNHHEQALEKMRERDAQASAARTAAFAEIAKASAASREKLVADARDAAAEYEALGRAVDAARSRIDALASAALERDLARLDAEEQAALAQVGPDGSQDVRRAFSRRREDARAAAAETANADRVLNAALAIEEAAKAMSAAELRIRQAEQDAASARADADGMISRASDIARGYGAGSLAGRTAIADAKVADQIAREAEATLKAVAAENAALIATADARRTEAQSTIELAKVTEETLALRRRALDTLRRSEDGVTNRERANRMEENTRAARGAAEQGNWDEASRLGKEREDMARGQAQVQRALDGAAAAAAAVKVPELNAEPLRVAVVQMGDQTIKVVGGLARDLAATKSALEAQKREMEKLGARLDNLAASSQ